MGDNLDIDDSACAGYRPLPPRNEKKFRVRQARFLHLDHIRRHRALRTHEFHRLMWEACSPPHRVRACARARAPRTRSVRSVRSTVRARAPDPDPEPASQLEFTRNGAQ